MGKIIPFWSMWPLIYFHCSVGFPLPHAHMGSTNWIQRITHGTVGGQKGRKKNHLIGQESSWGEYREVKDRNGGRDDQIVYMHEILKSDEKYPSKEDTHDATDFLLAWELGLQDE